MLPGFSDLDCKQHDDAPSHLAGGANAIGGYIQGRHIDRVDFVVINGGLETNYHREKELEFNPKGLLIKRRGFLNNQPI